MRSIVPNCHCCHLSKMSLVGVACEWMPSPPGILCSWWVCAWGRDRQGEKEWLRESYWVPVYVCVCVTLSPCHPGHGEKSIDLQLELGRLPLSSDEQTLWPSRVRRQVLGMLCRPAVRQLCVLLSFFVHDRSCVLLRALFCYLNLTLSFLFFFFFKNWRQRPYVKSFSFTSPAGATIRASQGNE